jgi:hypothetical protein
MIYDSSHCLNVRSEAFSSPTCDLKAGVSPPLSLSVSQP